MRSAAGRQAIGIIAVALILVGVACSRGDPELPDTDGDAVWTFLQDADYQKQWELWPGKGELYEGGEPHGALFTTYLNSAALEAVQGKTGSMPNGAIIVKENFTAEGTFELITVMYKVRNFNQDHNDWFWAKIGSFGEVQAEGRVVGCQACHGAARANDFVLTAPLR